MIIVDNAVNYREFGEANPGDCFVFEDNYYMKTNDPKKYNAVDLRSGNTVYIADHTEVRAIRVKAEVYYQ